MVFSSLLFLFRFLPLVFLLYYLTPRRVRNVVLFLFSLFFYAWGEPKYVFLMLFSITMDYTVGRLIDKAKREGKPGKAKGCLLFSVFMNLGILGFFKYADFIISSINAVSGLNLPLLNIPLPIGISFFTFQTMSYTIDVYRGNTDVQKNWISYGTYVSMFPQLIAGPIVQYKTIAKQMKERRENLDDFTEGIHRFVTGVGKRSCWRTTSAFSGMRRQPFPLPSFQWRLPGWEPWPIPSRSILISPVTPIWPSVSEKCSVSTSWKTSTIRIFPGASRNSGEDGISP